jgi:isoleucyl-tRNA synthetase
MPERRGEWALTEEEEARWAAVLRVRADVNKALEIARGEKLIGKPLDARVTLFVDESAREAFRAVEDMDLAPLFIVSEAAVVYGAGEGVKGENFPGLTVAVEPSALPRCERCWTHSGSVGSDSEHPTLCARCAAAIR